MRVTRLRERIANQREDFMRKMKAEIVGRTLRLCALAGKIARQRRAI